MRTKNPNSPTTTHPKGEDITDTRKIQRDRKNEERVRPQTTKRNAAFTLVYGRDSKDESIGIIKKALQTELGQRGTGRITRERNGRMWTW